MRLSEITQGLNRKAADGTRGGSRVRRDPLQEDGRLAELEAFGSAIGEKHD
jgi:hypothetical protein